MIRVVPKRSVLALSLLILAGCGGSGSGLLATVPPPVEFAGLRVGGVNELPAAGTYAGTVKLDRTTYRFDEAAGEWTLVDSVPKAEEEAAEAVVSPDGTVVLRRASASVPDFRGTLRVSNDPLEPSPTATLTSSDGTTALYPYVLRNGEPKTLTLVAHGRISGKASGVQSFDRYSFDLSLTP